MWYHYTLPVTAGTKENAPETKILKLTKGVITFLAIPHDVGANYNVKTRLYYHEHQIFPANPDEAACGCDFVEGGIEHLELDSAPYELKAKGYAPDAVEDHDVTILISVVPKEVAEPWQYIFLAQPKKVKWEDLT